MVRRTNKRNNRLGWYVIKEKKERKLNSQNLRVTKSLSEAMQAMDDKRRGKFIEILLAYQNEEKEYKKQLAKERRKAARLAKANKA